MREVGDGGAGIYTGICTCMYTILIKTQVVEILNLIIGCKLLLQQTDIFYESLNGIQDWIVFQDATLSSMAFYMYLLYRYWIQCIHEDKHTCIWGKKSVLNFLKYVLYFFTSAWSALLNKWRLHLCKWRLNFATLYMYIYVLLKVWWGEWTKPPEASAT